MKIRAKNVNAFQKRTSSSDAKDDNRSKIFHPIDETNAGCASSIPVQPESRAAVGQPENFKKNPAVAAAGPVTRILSGR